MSRVRSPSPTPTSLPAKNQIHFVFLKRAICREQSHALRERLGNNHPVKRIPVAQAIRLHARARERQNPLSAFRNSPLSAYHKSCPASVVAVYSSIWTES